MNPKIRSLTDLVVGYSFLCSSRIVTSAQVIQYAVVTEDIVDHNHMVVPPFEAPIVQGHLLLALVFSFHQEAVQLPGVPLVLAGGKDIRFRKPVVVGEPFLPLIEIAVATKRSRYIEVEWKTTVRKATVVDRGPVLYEATTILQYWLPAKPSESV
jgi:acyl dehydratase